jgi:hypothetical protein
MAKDSLRKEFRVKGVSNQLFDDVRTISKNMGITMSGFLKAKIREVVDSTPDHLRKSAS